MIPTLGAIVPAAVGVDIGCGMIAVRTQFQRTDLTPDRLAELRVAIEQAVPLSAGGMNGHLTDTATVRVKELEDLAGRLGDNNTNGVGCDPDAVTGKWRLQLGSLGSGNHFIEVTVDELDRVWLFLHSGSRGVGNLIAQRHIEVARVLMERWRIQLPGNDPDLAYLVEGTDEFWAYIRDLRWAQHFALLNRDEMMDRVVECLAAYVGEPVVEQERINSHHNFTEQETHFGKKVWLSRKGAIEARPGQPGLIPGSMGTASYVVTGLGNEMSLNSSPHGAGRSYSRSKARKTFTLEDLRAAMVGVEYRDTPAFMTRSRRRTSPSTRSWPTPPTWSRSGTRYARSSTSKVTDHGQRGKGAIPPPSKCRYRRRVLVRRLRIEDVQLAHDQRGRRRGRGRCAALAGASVMWGTDETR